VLPTAATATTTPWTSVCSRRGQRHRSEAT
jgi:hypothetical protein